MYSLSAPERSGAEDYASIVAQRRLAAREVLHGVQAAVLAAYGAYITSQGNGEVIQPIPLSNDEPDRLAENYRLLDKNASHQHIRDEVLACARFDMCPYCSVTTVDEIDHVLPKSVYPEFSVLAQNLVPSCGRCNSSKASTCFVSDGKSFPHPYLYHIPDGKILHADVAVSRGTVTWSFSLIWLPGMDERLFAAMQSMFEVLELEERYGQVSVVEVVDRAQAMDDQHDAGGPALVREYLQREAQSARRRGGENYWKTAILSGLAANQEFCAGGFRYFLHGP